MAVYVDALWLRRGRHWAHLMADTPAELHAMARRLGLPPRAYQHKPSGAHYDIDATVRTDAIALGAVALDRHADRARLHAVIARAREQGRGPRDAG